MKTGAAAPSPVGGDPLGVCHRLCEPRLQPPSEHNFSHVCCGFTVFAVAFGAFGLMLSASTQLLSKKNRRIKPHAHNQKHNPPFLITSGFTCDLCVEQQQRFTATSFAIKAKKRKKRKAKQWKASQGTLGRYYVAKNHCA